MNDNKDEHGTTPAQGATSGEGAYGNEGWTQFGATPPRAGGFRAGQDSGQEQTQVHPVPDQAAGRHTAEQPVFERPAEPVAAPPAGHAAGPLPTAPIAPAAPTVSAAPTVPTVPAAPIVPAQRTRLSAAQKLGAGLALAAMAVGGGVVGAFTATAFDGGTPVASSVPVARPVGDNATVADVAEAVQPSVVSIEVKSGQGGSEGSGVILTEDGMILTNNHVVDSAAQGGQLTVKFSDGKTATARLVGTDPATDLAVIKAENVSGLTKASLGDSDQIKVGDSVLAIGSPLGLSGSVSAGIVSALDRTLNVGGERRQQLPPGWGGEQQGGSTATTIGGAIQTDAAINPGNSGGALVNTQGQVIGINTAIATNGGEGNIGVGFAIPVNTAKHVAQQLIDTGKVTHAFLGVSMADAIGDAGGAMVQQVTEGSPAAQAGLKQGDLITKIGDTAVEGSSTVVGAIRGLKPGDRIVITYVRDGRTQTVTATLVEKTGE
ncbi:S1C family serine protease [Planomonospora venezuelensis]|uniref:Putative serine protease PepD n=1 Tax=Planomonospora venezuelensis TaxID=1999 RepID=A0A841D7M8_PLAVE|nr:trypsin-like peptidase domain-containing protein [Planomonospora venezuelensis]MBB5964165.1 putative serine protease PepD [Planomonospora venezuelensis]